MNAGGPGGNDVTPTNHEQEVHSKLYFNIHIPYFQVNADFCACAERDVIGNLIFFRVIRIMEYPDVLSSGKQAEDRKQLCNSIGPNYTTC